MLRSIMIAAVLIIQASTAILPTCAAGPDIRFAAATKAYNSRDYKTAVQRFEVIVHAEQQNEKARYYLGLSYKALGQNSLAQQQFMWISEHGFDRTCITYARQQMALMKNPVARAARPKPVVATQFSGSQSGGSQSFASQSSSSSQNATAQAPQKKNLGRCKVIFFETSWCHYCHEFAPQFEEARRKYQNKMDFQQMDAEHDGASLAQRYGIHSYPRLVYLDGSGKLLYNEGRGEFQDRIKELTGQ
ncbi:MAG: thioredoxin domain-containing protein [Candidatus Melainabacteria bacterium]|nr:thioredoxin domain-containing protein [Candidatus Melainabacteria bacterium]